MSIQTDNFGEDFNPAPRVVSAAPVSPREEAIERALRPKLLQEYVGQAKVREQLEIFIGAHSTMCCCLARRAWAKPRSATSLRKSSV